MVSTALGGATGNFSLSGIGASGPLAHSAPALISIQDYTISVSPSIATIAPNGTATFTVSATGINGYNGSIGLNYPLTQEPPYGTLSWSPKNTPPLNSISPNGSILFGLTAYTQGQYVLTVQGGPAQPIPPA
jgi:hypothetical protein